MILHSFSNQTEISRQLLEIPNNLLEVAQAEFGFIQRNNPEGIQIITTSGIWPCAGVAGFSTHNGAAGIAHLDDGTNIPAAIYLMRRVLNRFYLLTGNNPKFLGQVRQEIENQGGVVEKTEERGDGVLYNQEEGSLSITSGGFVFKGGITQRPRNLMLHAQGWQPHSLYFLYQKGILRHPIVVTSGNQRSSIHEIWARQKGILRGLIGDNQNDKQQFMNHYIRGQSFFDGS